MESRLCLSSGSAGAHVPAGTGIDAIALGDVNGDQVADVAVANHLNGQYLVSIYGGLGQPDGGLATGYAPELLATIPDPFSPSEGPLDVALGDFSGSGISELAISAKDFEQDLGLDVRAGPECGRQWTAQCAGRTGGDGLPVHARGFPEGQGHQRGRGRLHR